MSWDRLLSSIAPLPTWQENHEAFMRGKHITYNSEVLCPFHNK